MMTLKLGLQRQKKGNCRSCSRFTELFFYSTFYSFTLRTNRWVTQQLQLRRDNEKRNGRGRTKLLHFFEENVQGLNL